jgi:hypothetical protein
LLEDKQRFKFGVVMIPHHDYNSRMFSR